MKIKLLILTILFSVCNFKLLAQLTKIEIDQLNKGYVTALPNGQYKTIQDFINGTPSSSELLTIKVRTEEAADKEIEYPTVFFFDQADKKVKKVFAIVKDGRLFFSLVLGRLPKYRNKADNAQTIQLKYNWGFSQVMFGGENYLYYEAEYYNEWGEAIAVHYSGSTPQRLLNLKGVVWDYQNSELNIFRNCKDFNSFLSEASEGTIKCDDKYYPIEEVRSIIEGIK
ncbi:hypothetical protein AAOE16_00110 [Ekhidna sp. MALMAid0563]|uniref:hypothetical protein n=1 Tax=Ekhidna sp. MALMAid0563 TaxID=3143937 RepID=UPI0032E01635